MFKYCGKVQTFEEYTDYEFCDESPRHLYSLSHDGILNHWYGMLLISETDDGAFDHDEEILPDDLVSKLVKMIPENDLPV